MDNEPEQIFILNAAPSQSSASTQKIGEVEVPTSSQVNLENVEDFSHVCRTCATITEFVIPIFAGEGLQNNLADKIHKHLPIQVSEGDVLPRVVCYQCASTLLAWHELVQCALQADAALRARLTQQQETKSMNIKSNSSIEEETQSKFPPAPPYACGAPRACAYCSTSHEQRQYREHLVTAHADLLFHCEECHKYIHRKDFILHMSLHAAHYAERHERAQPAPRVAASQENEFSDHSDAEYGFGPLPESVFDAIEDSQDSQPLAVETCHTPDGENHSEESNKSTQPYTDNNNVSNLEQSLEANNFSHCIPEIETENPKDPGASATENSVPSNTAPEITVPSNTVPEKTVPSNTAPDITVPSNTAPEITVPSNTAPEKTVPSNTAPDITVPSNTAPEITVITNSKPTEQTNKKHKKHRTCPICGKEYTASSSYFYHMKYFHKGSKDHECDVCARKFGTKSSLTQHMSIHTGQYEFECKQCRKLFRSRASLYIHEQTHGGVKAWACAECPRAFRWRAQLHRHAARHAPERRHACGACGRAFSVRADLLRHARTHAAGAHACHTCARTFAQLRYLKAHVANQHATAVAKQSH